MANSWLRSIWTRPDTKIKRHWPTPTGSAAIKMVTVAARSPSWKNAHTGTDATAVSTRLAEATLGQKLSLKKNLSAAAPATILTVSLATLQTLAAAQMGTVRTQIAQVAQLLVNAGVADVELLHNVPEKAAIQDVDAAKEAARTVEERRIARQTTAGCVRRIDLQQGRDQVDLLVLP